MKKKILSIFCSGLMFFANAPCCAALGGAEPQLEAFNDMNNLNNPLNLELHLKKDSSAENSIKESGLHMTIDPVNLTLYKKLQPDGSWTTPNSSSYSIGDTLDVSLSLSYINEQDEDITMEFAMPHIDLPSSLQSDDTKKNETIKSLEKLKGLRFKLRDKSATYLKCEVNDVDKNDGRLTLKTEDSNDLTLYSSKPHSVSPDNTKTLILSISKDESTNQVSLEEAISILADLESRGYYRFQIQGIQVS